VNRNSVALKTCAAGRTTPVTLTIAKVATHMIADKLAAQAIE
jgi:hypothetical protein